MDFVDVALLLRGGGEGQRGEGRGEGILYPLLYLPLLLFFGDNTSLTIGTTTTSRGRGGSDWKGGVREQRSNLNRLRERAIFPESLPQRKRVRVERDCEFEKRE